MVQYNTQLIKKTAINSKIRDWERERTDKVPIAKSRWMGSKARTEAVDGMP